VANCVVLLSGGLDSATVYARRESMLTTRPHEWYGRYQCRPAPATGNMVDPVNLRAYTPSPV
jgi:hypothetical protein